MPGSPNGVFWGAILALSACAGAAGVIPETSAQPARGNAARSPAVSAAPAQELVPEPYRYDDPKLDSDGDTIFDPDDKCPREPGVARKGAKGCPQVSVEPESPISLLLELEEGSSSLEAAARFDMWKTWGKATVEHELCAQVWTFSMAPSSTELERLGEQRAEVARRSLVSLGVKPARITLNPNRTPEPRLVTEFGREKVSRSILLVTGDCGAQP